MTTRLKLLRPLSAAQADASHPDRLVWLSASAGTGKTHVLTARVLRLLLSNVDPSAILCLTFTKAGAAEMADRLHARLAYWVRLKDTDLAKDLFALGEPNDAAAIARARTLFARVLDARGGGLRIQTIHAFCQTLLGGFPVEAGMIPGFRPLEGREEAALARATLAALLVEAEAGGALGLVADVRLLSRRLGEGGAEGYLRACARRPDQMAALGGGIEAQLRRLLDLPAGDIEAAIAQGCCDDSFDVASLRRIAAANAAWGTATGEKHADIAARWLTSAPDKRAARLDELAAIALTASGEPRVASKKLLAAEPDYAGLAFRMAEVCSALLAMRARGQLLPVLAAGLRAGQAYAQAYAEAKRAAGAVDFDDLIRSADRLLNQPGMGDWIRYKLDQGIDHILVDEAQDTNVTQWSIVAALAGEFFAGQGARAGRSRTIFTVGDFKQAIFGFQGTSPEAFAAARHVFTARAAQADQAIQSLSLDRSYRSTPPVLAMVDRLLGELGPDALGLAEAALPHESARGGLPGAVTLWRPHSIETAEEIEDEGEEGWIDSASRGFARKLARQLRHWLTDQPLHLPGRNRMLRPEDILILVRRRSDLAALIVARLYAEGVPVAGVDRLRLNAPLAVRDLLAAIRFALQPEEDLTLAALLVSPLIGWDQAALLAVGHRRRGSLWAAVRDHPDHAATAEALRGLLAMADLVTPYRFLEAILSGPLDGRRRLLERLGQEARDPIEELLSAALAFEATATPSLQLFVDWFDRGEVDITRDASAPLDAVRVMTVHGAKGLQAPLVILADATGDPENLRGGAIDLAIGDVAGVPVFRPRKDEQHGAFADAVAEVAQREREEHWRLFYVALTRAEERLVIGGPLGPRAKGVAPRESWHAALARAFAGMAIEPVEDAIWGGAQHFTGDPVAARAAGTRVAIPEPIIAEPDWLRRPAPQEARPPRPLAPSSIGRDLVADPPPGPAMRDAARRGRLLHALFERLPTLAPADRPAAADRWLAGSAGVADPAERAALAEAACGILADPRFTPVFSPDALAEAPIAAVVGGAVIAGTVDRLLVEADRVLVVDFKTGRRVPASAEAAPEHHLRQMAAYAAALGVIFPGRRIEAALLYTAAPRLLALPPALLAAHNPGLAAVEQSLGDWPVEPMPPAP